MSAETDALKAEAERAVRRGELLDAVGLYQRVLVVEPDDPGALARLEALSDQISADAGAGKTPVASTPTPALTAEQRAERLVESGDARGALAIYSEILRIRPDHVLAAERKREIELSLDGAAPAQRPAPAREPPSSDSAPRLGKEQFLEMLLARIASRRRT
jgi:hypothetical protein